MLGIAYKKAPPTVYVMHFVDGRLRREGGGLSFFYFAPISTIVDVPLNSVEVPFIFQETTADFQAISFNGQLIYRVTDAPKVAALLDFSVNIQGEYLNSKDPRELLAQRLINTAQALAKSSAQRLSLRDALSGSETIAGELFTKLRSDQTITMLGVEILAFSLLAVKTSPETTRALEAEAREAILRQADQAVYSRRNAAVEEERRIKESELNTEIAVENKRREIREIKMHADIALEEQRTLLVDKTVENERKHSDSRAYALEAMLKPLRQADWKTLLAVSGNNGDSRLAISMAFQELAANAGKIGQLNLSPDLLTSLMATKEK